MTDPPIPAVRLVLLGGFRAEIDGQAVPESRWTRPSAKALLKLLALTPGHRLTRDQAMDCLWPNLPVESAEASLRKAVAFARAALEPARPPRGPSSYVLLTDGLLLLAPERVTVDADHYRAVAEAAIAAPEQASLRTALELYTGELLPEDRYVDWAADARADLAALHRAVLVALADLAERDGDLAAAVEHLRLALQADETDEELHRRLIAVLAQLGRTHEARRQYQACRAALARELDATPEPATEDLYQRIVAGRASTATPVSDDARPPLPPIAAAASGRLVGREEPLVSLDARLQQAVAGSGALVLVEGEAGIGKTSLLAECARRAYQRGAVVLWGTANEAGGALPYGPFVEALDTVFTRRSPAECAALANAHPELARLVPALAAHALPSPVPPAEGERTRLSAAVAGALARLCGDRPLLFVVDDLHAADAASLFLLHYLASAARTRRWLLLGGYRSAGAGIGGSTERLVGQLGSGHRLRLEALDRPAVDQLVQVLLPGAPIDPALTAALYRQSVGNPLFTRELLQSLRELDAISLGHGRWLSRIVDPPVPRSIRDLLTERIDRLGPVTGGILRIAAVAGGSCTYTIVRAATALDDDVLLDGVDAALAAGVLVERGEGYVFAHPLYQAAVYERLAAARRRQLHAAVARALERQRECGDGRPASADALAHHWQAAGEAARAVPHLAVAADDAAAVYATDEALARVRRALALLGDLGQWAEAETWTVEFLERLADLELVASSPRAAHNALQEALRRPARSPLDRARLLRKSARTALMVGDQDLADSTLASSRAALETEAATPERALELTRWFTTSAQAHWLARRFPLALAAAETAAHQAEDLGALADCAQAYEMIALACLPLGDWQRGLEYERRRMGIVDVDRAVVEVGDVHI